MAIRNIFKGDDKGYFGSSLAQALTVYRRTHPLNPTITEVALAASTLYTEKQLEAYCSAAGTRFRNEEAQAKADTANMALLNKLVSVARGTHSDDTLNEAFRAYYGEWKDTAEGQKYADGVIQFNAAGPGGAGVDEADEYIRAMKEARSISRGAGRQAREASASSRLREVEEAVRTGGKAATRSQLSKLLGLDE